MRKDLIKSFSEVPDGDWHFDGSTENDEVYFRWSAVSQRYAPVEVLL